MRALEFGPKVSAFCDMLAVSEMGTKQLALSDDGYNVLYGSTAAKLSLFANGYAKHPAIFVPMPRDAQKRKSSAAGRYQILFHIWDALCTRLRVNDFQPETQDRMAVELIRECGGALDAIEADNVTHGIALCAKTWASLPGANYPGQRMNGLDELLAVYNHALAAYHVDAKPDFSNVECGVESTAATV